MLNIECLRYWIDQSCTNGRAAKSLSRRISHGILGALQGSPVKVKILENSLLKINIDLPKQHKSAFR